MARTPPLPHHHMQLLLSIKSCISIKPWGVLMLPQYLLYTLGPLCDNDNLLYTHTLNRLITVIDPYMPLLISADHLESIINFLLLLYYFSTSYISVLNTFSFWRAAFDLLPLPLAF